MKIYLSRPGDCGRKSQFPAKNLLVSVIVAAGLSGCSPHVRYVSTPCLTQEQYDQQKQAEPPKIHDKLTGEADKDLRVVAGSAIRLRAWGEGMLGILEGCR